MRKDTEELAESNKGILSLAPLPERLNKCRTAAHKGKERKKGSKEYGIQNQLNLGVETGWAIEFGDPTVWWIERPSKLNPILLESTVFSVIVTVTLSRVTKKQNRQLREPNLIT